jgi:outer membrane protein, heavy metal efflux system
VSTRTYAILLYAVCVCIFYAPHKLISENISFDQAVAKTIAFSPKLRIAASEIDSAAGLRTQSAVLPNPIAAWSVENVWGNRNWHGWESADSRYEIAQLVELGGKRGFRMQTAKFQYYATQAGFDARQLSLLNRLLKLFTLVSAAQENLDVASDQVKVAEEVYKTVLAKVEAGKVSLIQQNKAEIALSTAQINLEKAQAEFVKSKERISVLWGAMCPDFDRVYYPFYEVGFPTPIEKCLSDLRENPQLLRSQMDYMAAYHNLNLEKSRAIPDVTVTLGCKVVRDPGGDFGASGTGTRAKSFTDRGMILGASIPLPLFNRNQGNIESARAQANKSKDQYIDLELALENKLTLAHVELVRAYNEAEKIRTTVLKAAVQSFQLAQEGYKEGKFEYLDMLDSQKTLFEVKERYIQALINYHQSQADIEYLNTLDEGS